METCLEQEVKTTNEALLAKALLAKRRMLEWSNPVEFVNNLYGCHPGEEGDYFGVVFGYKQKGD